MVGMCVYIYILRETETDTYNYVLVFHTKKASSCSPREENRMRPLVPFVCLPVLICMASWMGVCCICAGWCVHFVHVQAHTQRNTHSAPSLVETRGLEL